MNIPHVHLTAGSHTQKLPLHVFSHLFSHPHLVTQSSGLNGQTTGGSMHSQTGLQVHVVSVGQSQLLAQPHFDAHSALVKEHWAVVLHAVHVKVPGVTVLSLQTESSHCSAHPHTVAQFTLSNGQITSALQKHFSSGAVPVQSHLSEHPQPSAVVPSQTALVTGHVKLALHSHTLFTQTHLSIHGQTVVL